MHVDECLELGDDLRMGADRELRLCSLLEEGEVELLEARDFLPRERFVAELRQRLSSPERERIVEQRRTPHGLTGPGGVDEAPDASQVELLWLEPHDVARRAGLDHVRTERLSQLRDEVLERGHRRRRWIPLPERLDETVERDDPSRLEQEHREQGPLLRTADRDRFAICASLQGPRMANSTNARRL
jgi:hypothetical protein